MSNEEQVKSQEEWAKKHFPAYSQTYLETLEHCACGEWKYRDCLAKKDESIGMESK